MRSVKILLLILGIFILVVSWFSYPGNKVAQLFVFFAPMVFFVGLLTPKLGVYLLVVLTAYLDAFKRMTIIDGLPNTVQLYAILGCAPVLVVSIFLGQSYRKRVDILHDKVERKTFLLACTVAFVNTVVVLGYGAMYGYLAGLANAAAYCTLIYTIPSIFLPNGEWKKLLRFILIVYIPVVAYMFYQSAYGLADYEIEYLLTGLSMEIRIFDDHQLRLFSTMNSAANFSTVICMLGACWLVNLDKGTFALEWTFKSVISLILAGLFFWSAYYSLSRGGWITGGMTILALICYRGRKTAVLGIVLGVCTFITLAWSGRFILNNNLLKDWTNAIVSDDASVGESMALRLGTFEGRLDSLSLTFEYAERWTPFGIMFKGGGAKDVYGGDVAYYGGRTLYYVHDAFSDLLLRIGYIPLCFLLIALIVFVVQFSSRVAQSKLHDQYCTMRVWACMCMGILVGYFSNTAQLRTYPVNFFFYMFLGLLIGMYFRFSQQEIELIDQQHTK